MQQLVIINTQNISLDEMQPVSSISVNWPLVVETVQQFVQQVMAFAHQVLHQNQTKTKQ